MRVRTQGEQGKTRDALGNMTYYNSCNDRVTTFYSSEYYKSFKICKDDVHPNYPNSGGPFSLTELRQSFSDAHMKTGYTGYVNPSTGCIGYGIVYDIARRVAPTAAYGYPDDPSAACKAYGPEAWDKFKPKLTSVNLGQFFAEIRDTPRLFQARLKEFKDLGSGYLNVQFGWKPFISDLRNWYQSIIRLDRQLANLQKHNGKWLKRGGTLVNTNNVIRDQNCTVYPTNGLTVLSKEREVETSEHVWFSGSFRYYIPGLTDGNWGKLKGAQQLWGLELTPALVYELIPYSWLLDWFSNVGNVISNYTSITDDNMAAKYAYIMRHTRTRVTCKARLKGTYSVYGQPTKTLYGNPSSTITIETKSRAEASPFGFNVDLPDFSNWQISILAALGLSYL